MNTPWRLTIPFDDKRHLFYGKIKTGYKIEAFYCSCGHTESVIKNAKQNIGYICPQCDNSHFFDANAAWENIDLFVIENKNVTLSFDYNVTSSENSIVLSYITLIPHDIDFLRNKILFEKKSIYSIEVTIDGEVKKDYAMQYNPRIFMQLQKRIVRYMRRYKVFKIPYSTDGTTSLGEIIFFLKHKHLKDISFYRWKNIEKIQNGNLGDMDIYRALKIVSNFRREKSVKRAIYSYYINQMQHEGTFDPDYIDLFTDIIKDPNILVKFLKLDYSSWEYSASEMEPMILFLKKHYTEKQIFKLFVEAQDSMEACDFFTYMIDLIYSNTNNIALYFRKPKCNIESIYHEVKYSLHRSKSTGINNHEFVYGRSNIKACGKVDKKYSVKLPRDNEELFSWSDHMHNCIAEYSERIKDNQTLIYGFFKGDSLEFAVEVSDNTIIQASGRCNAELNKSEKYVLQTWFYRYFGKGYHQPDH